MNFDESHFVDHSVGFIENDVHDPLNRKLAFSVQCLSCNASMNQFAFTMKGELTQFPPIRYDHRSDIHASECVLVVIKTSDQRGEHSWFETIHLAHTRVTTHDDTL